MNIVAEFVAGDPVVHGGVPDDLPRELAQARIALLGDERRPGRPWGRVE